MMCVMTPCVCLLTVLTGKINHLLERKDREEGVQGQEQVQHGDGQEQGQYGGERVDRNKEHIEQVKSLKNNEEGVHEAPGQAIKNLSHILEFSGAGNDTFLALSGP